MAILTILTDALLERQEQRTGRLGDMRVRSIIKALKAGDKKSASAIMRSPMTDRSQIVSAVAAIIK